MSEAPVPQYRPEPRYFSFNDEIWSVEEREPTKVELPPHQAILYFRAGKRVRWLPHTRAMLRLYSVRDLQALVVEATPVPAKE